MHTQLLRRSAVLAAVLVVAMFVTWLVTGVGQEALQVYHSPLAYQALLVANPAALTLTLGLDDAFIACYLVTFVMLALTRWQAPGARALTGLAVGLLAVTGALDLAENFHFLALLGAAVDGVAPSVGEVQAQVVESLLKFHCSYLGLLLLGYALPRTTRLERALAFSLRWVQLPVGVLIPVMPHALAVPLVMVRFTFFLAALLALAAASKRPGFGSDAPA
jgi:hypothetical protein